MQKSRTTPFILSLKEGQNLFQGITHYATSVNLKSAIFTGIGAISNSTLGFYHRDTKQHTERLFEGTYEIASLSGNLTLTEEGFFVHIHAAIGDKNFEIFGGHLIHAEAAASTEIAIIPLNYIIKRHKHRDLGIHVIRPFMNIMTRSAR